MHSSMLYMMALTLLVIILLTHVQATPIPVPTVGKKPDDAAIGSASVKPDTAGPVYEALDPSKMDVFERAKEATAKLLAKRDQDAAASVLIKRSTIDTISTFLSKRAAAAAVPEDRDLSVGDDRTAKTDAVFEPMNPAKTAAFERAEDATTKLLAKRAVEETIAFLAKRATDADRDFAVGDGNNSEKRETSGVGIKPPPLHFALRSVRRSTCPCVLTTIRV
ncbi:hypothetical protein BGW39_009720 [Mortierella sp. 14UC]|nr:hypothetical protein BGW39_009720 [Mortierella sp. 14UC]